MFHNQSLSSVKKRNNVKTILVVEDDKNIGELIVSAFVQETPYQALLAVNGSQALKLVQDIQPNMLILDNRLPDMKGIELYDRLHTMETLENIPVLLMSANIPLLEVQRRKMHYLNKPFELDDLLDKVEKMIA
ncbi:MAG TPA: response regulator [Ktedonobacteraceae bacterium]|nr:response regulator [Ktedonobacteraceae bacterium]